jgi:hypothetical protein
MVQRLPFLALLLSAALVGGCQRGFDRSALKPDADGFISWEDAKRLILSGETTNVAQNHERIVYITLKDGAEFKAREDRLDEVIRLIRDHGLEGQIGIATE